MKRLAKKHPLAISWFHWLNFPLLMVMIWSGLLIYWANPVYRVGLGTHTLFKMTLPELRWEKLGVAFRLAKQLGVPPEKVPHNIERYGNTTAGTLPILFHECVADGRVKPGMLICFTALGSGLHWGAALYRA